MPGCSSARSVSERHARDTRTHSRLTPVETLWCTRNPARMRAGLRQERSAPQLHGGIGSYFGLIPWRVAKLPSRLWTVA
jgi:hypothetical protein